MAETATQQVLTPTEIVGALAASILGKRQERLDASANKPPFKPRRNYASGLSACTRQMTYAHVAWEQKEPFTADGVARMEDGTHEERLVLAELVADGFDVVEQQVQLDDDKYWVTGKIDGKLRWQGKRIPFEIKRVSPYAFDQLNTVEDFKRSEWDLKKLRQLTLYLLLHNEEAGLFILSNGIGGRKVVVVPLDYPLGEQILKSLDDTNAALTSGVLPERIPYHSKICGYCPFKRTCLPDITFGEGAVMGDEELNTAVAQYVALKPQASAFEQVKRAIANTVKEKPLIIAGEYLITGEWKERHVKAQDAKPAQVTRYWGWDVESKGTPDA